MSGTKMARKIVRPWEKMQPVMVDWIDAMGTSGWCGERHGFGSDMRCCSFGHLVHEDKDSVTIAMNRSAYGHGDYMKIPRCSVRKVTRLKI